MTPGNWIALCGFALSFCVVLGGVVRWALRAEIAATLNPLQSKLERLSNAAQLLADQMQAAQIAHKEERGELHDGLKQLREFLEKLDNRVDEHGERLAAIDAQLNVKEQDHPAPKRKPKAITGAKHV